MKQKDDIHQSSNAGEIQAFIIEDNNIQNLCSNVSAIENQQDPERLPSDQEMRIDEGDSSAHEDLLPIKD